MTGVSISSVDQDWVTFVLYEFRISELRKVSVWERERLLHSE